MIGVDIRFMELGEWDSIKDIESECSWPIENFDEWKQVFQTQDAICLAGVYEGQVVAYSIMEVTKSHISIARLAVHEDFRRMGIGTQLLNYIIGILLPAEGQKIAIDTHERDLPGHLFLKKNGFRAVAVVNNYLDDDDVAYIFYYGGEPDSPAHRFSLPI